MTRSQMIGLLCSALASAMFSAAIGLPPHGVFMLACATIAACACFMHHNRDGYHRERDMALMGVLGFVLGCHLAALAAVKPEMGASFVISMTLGGTLICGSMGWWAKEIFAATA